MPNLRWMDGVMRDAERLRVRNWRIKAKDREGWRGHSESDKTSTCVVTPWSV
jgi:hypothetical protein